MLEPVGKAPPPSTKGAWLGRDSWLLETLCFLDFLSFSNQVVLEDKDAPSIPTFVGGERHRKGTFFPPREKVPRFPHGEKLLPTVGIHLRSRPVSKGPALPRPQSWWDQQ